jgi:hypothetical protein
MSAGSLRRAAIACGLLSLMAACANRLVPADYAAWERATKVQTTRRIPGHEEPYRISYINPIGETVKPTLKAGVRSWDYPRGTIIVKEGYVQQNPPVAGDHPSRVYAMVKDPANPRAKGGWVWVVREGNSAAESVIDAPFCVDCHSYANQQNPYGDLNPGAEFRDDVYLPYLANSGG